MSSMKREKICLVLSFISEIKMILNILQENELHARSLNASFFHIYPLKVLSVKACGHHVGKI